MMLYAVYCNVRAVVEEDARGTRGGAVKVQTPAQVKSFSLEAKGLMDVEGANAHGYQRSRVNGKGMELSSKSEQGARSFSLENPYSDKIERRGKSYYPEETRIP